MPSSNSIVHVNVMKCFMMKINSDKCPMCTVRMFGGVAKMLFVI